MLLSMNGCDRDCWDYLKKYSLPYHPLHDQGFPSIGDVQSTIPVSRDKWFEYAGERSGRFQVSSILVGLLFRSMNTLVVYSSTIVSL